MRILIHICCAHCFLQTLEGLRAEFGAALEARGYFFNPNIHPLLEFRRRLKAVKVLGEREPTPVDYEEAYGLEPFCDALGHEREAPRRCEICYRLRLDGTAFHAARLGMEAFTSTLITSRHQDHALIDRAGKAAGEKHGIPWLYRDLREIKAPESAAKGLYRQQYCGCIFSEADRFGPTTQHLYRGP